MDSDFSFLWLFAVVPDEPPSDEQQPLPDSAWFVVDEPTQLPRALCRPLAQAGQRYRRSPRNDIDGHGDHGGPTHSKGPCHGRGGPLSAVAAGSQTPNGRAGLPGTVSLLGPAGWPPLARLTTSHRWPARCRR